MSSAALEGADQTGESRVKQAGVSLSVVIPVYNEEEILAETVTAIVRVLRSDDAVSRFEVIVSENGSSDRTRAVARKLASSYPEVVMLASDVPDYGAAMRDAFKAARGSYIINFDADYYDVAFVRRALDIDADIVIAAKGAAGSEDMRGPLRRVATWAFGVLLRRLLGLRTTETHGMKVFRRAAIEPLLPQVRATKDLFDTELVARAERCGLSIAELPIKTAEMRQPRSTILRRVPRTLWGLIMMRHRFRAARHAVVTEECRPPSFLAGPQGDHTPFTAPPFVLGRLQVTVRGAEDAFLCLDEDGVAVLVLVLGGVTKGTGAQIADELDRITLLRPARMTVEASDSPRATVAEAHAAHFGIRRARPKLNHEQRAVMLVREPPGAREWEELHVELGERLEGLYRMWGGVVTPLKPPERLRGERGPRQLPRTMVGTGAILLLGLAIVLGVREASPEAATSDAAVAGAVVHDVATGVSEAATHSQWLGQDRLLRTSGGTLLAVYGDDQGLQVRADHANQGRSWRPLATIPTARPASLSVAIDDADRLHIAFSDGSRVAYTTVQEHGGRWTNSAIVEVDDNSRAPYLDIAYDEAAGVAHVVWVAEGPEGQAPRWAAVTSDAAAPRMVQAERLAPPGTDTTVLVNIAAGPDSAVLTTYRRGDSPTGWFARALTHRAGGDFSWTPEEKVPTEATIGAAALVADAAGVAHLILRDSSVFELTYFTRMADGGWSEGETAVDAESTEEIDFPSLTVDQSSQLIYLFFYNDRAQAQPGVRLAVRDPVGGWQASSPLVSAEAIPNGAFFPAAIADTAGTPMVLWTTGGTAPVLQAAAVVPGAD